MSKWFKSIGTNDVSVTDFEGVCNGSFDDTPALQRAVNVCKQGVGTSVLRIDGDMLYDPAFVDFSGGKKIKLLVNGSLRPQSTIVLTSDFDIEGVGGSDIPVQFGHGGNCCRIYAPDGDVPAIRVVDPIGHALKNINIYDCFRGIVADGARGLGALLRMDNVNILQTRPGGVPLLIDAFFWLWAENCRFLSSENGEKSVKITNSSREFSQAGLIFFRDCITAGRGISACPDVGRVGNLSFSNHHHESLTTGEDFFHAAAGSYNIEFDGLGVSDSHEGAGYTFDVGGVTGFRLLNSGPHSFKAPPASMVNETDTPENYINRTRDVGSRSVHSSGQHRGALFGRLLSRGHMATAPWGVGEPITFDLPAGRVGGMLYTKNQIAPDGSTTATKVEAVAEGSPLSVFATTLYQAGRKVVPGDRFVLFGMVKMLDMTTGGNSDTGVAFCGLVGQPVKAITGHGRSNSEGAPAGLDHAIADDGWLPLVVVIEATAQGVPDLVIGNVIRKASSGYLVWKLAARFIPASLGFTDADLNRLTQAYGQMHGANSGVVSVMEHQPFRTGLGQASELPSAKAAGIGAQFYNKTICKPVWSDGSVWKDSSGNSV